MVLPEESNTCFCGSNELHDFVNDNHHPISPQMTLENGQSHNHDKYCQTFSDPALDYINRCLLEEDNTDHEMVTGIQEAALRDMEKPLYDILGEEYPPPMDNQYPPSQSKQYQNLLAIEFQRGVEEGKKFVPNLNNLPLINLQPCNSNSLKFRLGEEKESGLMQKLKGKKTTNDDVELDVSEGRNRKMLMLSKEEIIRDEMFDKVLLCLGEIKIREDISSLYKLMELEANLYKERENQIQNEREYINLRVLLISCAEAISSNDNAMARALIKKIRKHTSPIGNAIQRLACILVDGLEARLSGTGSSTVKSYQFVTKQISTTNYLKAFHLGIRSTPIMRFSYHVANKSILKAAGNYHSNASSKILHVVDFGITFGFQWTYLIQAISEMNDPDGPLKLRITGIDLPQPGFRPSERINETGRRLEEYARSFGVPFEYQGIASHWESISIDDLRIKDDEVLIFNSVNTLGRIRDEFLLGRNNPMNKILNLIHDAKPKIFIQGTFNFSNSPFFITRFRMVLVQYFRFFDMLDTLIPRDQKHREIIERELLGPSIFNQVACEGSDLVIRSETYKECHMRNLQNALEWLPMDPTVVKQCTEKVKNFGYSKEFFVEEDLNWFLLGWKGNIIYAISLWKPKAE